MRCNTLPVLLIVLRRCCLDMVAPLLSIIPLFVKRLVGGIGCCLANMLLLPALSYFLLQLPISAVRPVVTDVADVRFMATVIKDENPVRPA